MKKFRGFRVRVWRSVSGIRSRIHRCLLRKKSFSYLRLRSSQNSSPSREPKRTVAGKVVTYCHDLAKHFTSLHGDQKRRLPGSDRTESRPPKGHLVVYVGGADPRRFLVPVVYFNHPLFGELLKESEEVYGFHHPGGITIPCPISDFEKVRTRVEACSNSNGRWTRRSEKKLPWF